MLTTLTRPTLPRADLRLPAAPPLPRVERPAPPVRPAPAPARPAAPGLAPPAKASPLRRAIAGEVAPLKRVVDVVGAAVLLVLLAPVFLTVAALIKLYDRGPVLFWQTRVGRRGRCFAFPKFRSMVVNAEALQLSLMDQNHHAKPSITWKMKQDPRTTPIGRFIRKTSIDELPQLWCVLNGNMSLVGPRPPLPREVDLYTPEDLRRLEVAPGLTCLWQVRGRGDLPFEDQVALDIEYIETQSLWLDLKLLVLTVPAVLLGRGAY